jgi:hypothetical protein
LEKKKSLLLLKVNLLPPLLENGIVSSVQIVEMVVVGGEVLEGVDLLDCDFVSEEVVVVSWTIDVDGEGFFFFHRVS